MENQHFDALVSALTPTSGRRVALRTLVITVGAALVGISTPGIDAVKRKHKKKRKGRAPAPAPPVAPPKQLMELCNPQTDQCSAGLICSSPTTRHTCSSTVAGISTWCCAPNGGFCSLECACCGNHECDFANGRTGNCRPII